jgi:hypothetical protein
MKPESNKLANRATIMWLALLALAFLNGALREFGLKPFLSEPVAQLVSASTGISMMTFAVRFAWKWIAIPSIAKAAFIGLSWLIATALFETFLLNRWIGDLSWEEIRQTYNVSSGEVWPFVLFWVGLLPLANFVWDTMAAKPHLKRLKGQPS